MQDPRFPETLEYLFRLLPMFQRDGKSAYKKDLTNTRELCWVLGLPQWRIKTIHIAGTNGKGSVSSMLASVLQEAGYKTGLYTSPHLISFTERIRINGKAIPQRNVVEFVDQMKPFIERVRPSFFELTVAMAFQHFADEEVDIAIIETGMGGRLDSTNVIRPEICAVTNISYDHMEFLGDTLAAIAGEKAGIIKAYTPLIVGKRHPETDPVFEEKSEEVEAPLWFAEDRFEARVLQSGWQGQRIALLDREQDEETTWELDLPGIYQQENLQTVMQVLWALEEDGWNFDEKHIQKGLSRVRKNTGLRGRMEQLAEQPLTLCDVGHNEAGIRQVLAQLSQFESRHLHFVWGMVSDKDHAKVLAMLPKEASYYWVCPAIPRGLPVEDMKAKATEAGLAGEAWPTVAKGVEAARAAAGPGEVVFIGGSTFVVADALQGFTEERTEAQNQRAEVG